MHLIVDGRVFFDTNIAHLISHILMPHEEEIDEPNEWDKFVDGLH